MVAYLTFAVMGIGMATPYLIFGLVPQAVRMLPKPGNWMVTFKEIAGFVLMATVVFMFYFLDKSYFLPALVMCLGVATGLWMYGKVQYTASMKKPWVIASGAALATLITMFGFSLNQAGEADLAWQPFSEAKVAELRGQGKTILIDFSAKW